MAEKSGLEKILDVAFFLPKFFADSFYHSLQKRGIIKNSFEDVVVVSYPKSGRTWLHVMLDYLRIHCKYYHDSSRAIYLPNVEFNIQIDHEYYKNKRIIYVVRDPRDVIVSSYYQATKREQEVFDGSISEFVRDPKLGIGKLIDFQKNWIQQQETFDKFMVVTYEDLKKQTEKVLADIVAFLNAKNISKRKIKRAVRLFQFENMKMMEKSSILKIRYGKPLKPAKSADKDSYKVRKGKVKGYKDVLSPKDVEYCNSTIKKKNLVLYM